MSVIKFELKQEHIDLLSAMNWSQHLGKFVISAEDITEDASPFGGDNLYDDMDLIFETDIGRDPDDMFALLYMIQAGVNIRCITISPGDEDQVAVTKAILDKVGLKIPVGIGKLNREGKTSSGGVHYQLLNLLR